MSVRSSAVGLAAVVVLMTAGAAQSLSGTNTVDSGDIVDGQVTSADVANNGLYGVDINPGRRIVYKIVNLAIDAELAFVIDCPTGTTLSGGGFKASSSDVYVTDSYPYDLNTWRVRAENWSDVAESIRAYAICDAL